MKPPFGRRDWWLLVHSYVDHLQLQSNPVNVGLAKIQDNHLSIPRYIFHQPVILWSDGGLPYLCSSQSWFNHIEETILKMKFQDTICIAKFTMSICYAHSTAHQLHLLLISIYKLQNFNLIEHSKWYLIHLREKKNKRENKITCFY